MSTMYGNVTYVPRTFYANREEMLKSYAESVAGNDGFALWFGDIVQAFSTIELSTSPNSMQMDVSRSKGSHLKILVSNEGAGDSVALLGNEKMDVLGIEWWSRFLYDSHEQAINYVPTFTQLISALE
ncbi:hypothetical protein JHK87_043055 [Glycine soja]|nr:hypothetical protein JHK87_043055 [Glycine soja]